MSNLYIFFQNPSSQLAMTVVEYDRSVTDLPSFHGLSTVPGATLSNTPSPAVFGGDLYVFYQDVSNSGTLMYAVQSPALTGGWQVNQVVPGAFMSSSPSAVVSQGLLWVFYQGGGNDGNLYYSTLSGPGGSWQAQQQINGAGISASPSAIVQGVGITVFYQGQGNSGTVWQTSLDTVSYGSSTELTSVNGGAVGLTGSPGAVAASGTSYMLYHQGQGGNSGYLACYDSASQEDNFMYYDGFGGGNDPSGVNPSFQTLCVTASASPAGCYLNGLQCVLINDGGLDLNFASIGWLSAGSGFSMMAGTAPSAVAI